MFDIVERRLRLHYVSAVFAIARDCALWRNPRVNLWSVARLKIESYVWLMVEPKCLLSKV